MTFEPYLSSNHPRRRFGQKTEYGQDTHRLTGPRFADYGQHFVRIQVPAHSVNGTNGSLDRVELDYEIPNRKDGFSNSGSSQSGSFAVAVDGLNEILSLTDSS